MRGTGGVGADGAVSELFAGFGEGVVLLGRKWTQIKSKTFREIRRGLAASVDFCTINCIFAEKMGMLSKIHATISHKQVPPCKPPK
jgi:hypothetical protein